MGLDINPDFGCTELSINKFCGSFGIEPTCNCTPCK